MTSSPPDVVVRAGRPWLGIVLGAVLCLLFLVGWVFDIQSFAWFISTMAVYAVVLLIFLGWWLSRRAFTWIERVVGIFGVVLIAVIVGRVSTHYIRPMIFLLTLGLPLVLSAWGTWAFFAALRPSRFRLAQLLGCFAAAWGVFLLVRTNGTGGNMRADIHWRWTPSAEEIYLAHRLAPATALVQPAARPATRPVVVHAGDWPGFRGVNRDGIAHGQRIALDWQASPPTVLWRERVGPAWSSMAIVDNHLYTQEQRGEREAVVCRDATSGHEIWAHETPGRFDEGMSGSGPRATPTFADGRIYALGARGALDCLEAGSGKLCWSRDISVDAGAAIPVFGFSSSPLVGGQRVFVFAGGEGKKGLLAYSIEGGPPVWTADAGKMSYSSPQRFTFGSASYVVMFTNEGLFAVNESDGTTCWQFPVNGSVGVPVSIQPCQTGADAMILGHGGGFGAAGIRLAVDQHIATQQWVTRQLKPSFNDMVFDHGNVYGFDGTVFCCLDAATGRRHWRDGRYGGGQVLLLADQSVMIVSSEDGQAVLLRCNPDRLEELGRIPVISGKAWNHPAIAQGKLYLRSDGEMACVALEPSEKRESSR